MSAADVCSLGNGNPTRRSAAAVSPRQLPPPSVAVAVDTSTIDAHRNARATKRGGGRHPTIIEAPRFAACRL